MRKYGYRNRRGFDFGDFEITKREIIASISIIAVMILIGVLISGKISERQMDKNEVYNKAVKIGEKLKNNKRSKPILALDKNGNIIYEFPSVREAARFLGNKRADSNIHSGIKKNQKRYGYYWKFK